MSDTPITDKSEVPFSSLCNPADAMWVPSKVSRALERQLVIAKLALDLSSPHEKALIDYAKKHREACEQIVALAADWDSDGATVPKPPLSWESVARMAMDYAKYAIAATAPHG